MPISEIYIIDADVGDQFEKDWNDGWERAGKPAR